MTYHALYIHINVKLYQTSRSVNNVRSAIIHHVSRSIFSIVDHYQITVWQLVSTYIVLSYTLLPANSTIPNIKWSTHNPAIVCIICIETNGKRLLSVRESHQEGHSCPTSNTREIWGSYIQICRTTIHKQQVIYT